jgi:hypothetical protein
MDAGLGWEEFVGSSLVVVIGRWSLVGGRWSLAQIDFSAV